MSADAWIAIITLAVAVVLFVSKWIPLAVTALSIPLVLAITGVLSPEQSLRGFGNQAVIALAGILLLGAGLQESGVATLCARGLERVGGRGPTRLVILVMVAAAVLSAFMSNTATVAIFLPAVAVLSRRTGVAASKLLIPLAYAGILGGTLTLIGTTPNLILGNELRLRTGSGLGMFEFAAIGGPIVLVGIAFMATVGWRLLPDTRSKRRPGHVERQEALAEAYGLTRTLFHVGLDRHSPLIGRALADSGLRSDFRMDAMLVLRATPLGRRALQPRAQLRLQPGDVLYIEGEPADARRMAETLDVELREADADEVERLLGRGVTLAEVTLAPRSGAIGHTLLDLDFRKKYGLHALSLWRGGEVQTADLATRPLALGDALLVSGPLAKVRELAEDAEFLVLGQGHAVEEDVSRAPVALALLAAALVPPLFGWLPLALSAMGAAVLMVVTGCLSVDGARRSVDYTILFLVIGTIPLGIALDASGLAADAAGLMKAVHDTAGAPGLVACLFLAAALLSTTSNNAAAAVILAPVAFETAAATGFDVTRAFLAVALGTSCAFMLPFAHACNLMVMGPAGYRTRDFVVVGGILTVLVSLTAVLLLMR